MDRNPRLRCASRSRGERTGRQFMDEVENYAREVVERAKTFGYEEVYGNDEPIGKCPYSGRDVVETRRE